MGSGSGWSMCYTGSILMGLMLAGFYFFIGQFVFYTRATVGEIVEPVIFLALFALVVRRRYSALARLNAALFILIVICFGLPDNLMAAFILVATWAVTHGLVLAITFLGRRAQPDRNVMSSN
jgi:hypothetical protein